MCSARYAALSLLSAYLSADTQAPLRAVRLWDPVTVLFSAVWEGDSATCQLALSMVSCTSISVCRPFPPFLHGPGLLGWLGLSAVNPQHLARPGKGTCGAFCSCSNQPSSVPIMLDMTFVLCQSGGLRGHTRILPRQRRGDTPIACSLIPGFTAC